MIWGPLLIVVTKEPAGARSAVRTDADITKPSYSENSRAMLLMVLLYPRSTPECILGLHILTW